MGTVAWRHGRGSRFDPTRATGYGRTRGERAHSAEDSRYQSPGISRWAPSDLVWPSRARLRHVCRTSQRSGFVALLRRVSVLRSATILGRDGNLTYSRGHEG